MLRFVGFDLRTIRARANCAEQGAVKGSLAEVTDPISLGVDDGGNRMRTGWILKERGSALSLIF